MEGDDGKWGKGFVGLIRFGFGFGFGGDRCLEGRRVCLFWRRVWGRF